ncbi:MAG: cellulase family glycosylhydrolase [Anaerolineales bacterium]
MTHKIARVIVALLLVSLMACSATTSEQAQKTSTPKIEKTPKPTFTPTSGIETPTLAPTRTPAETAPIENDTPETTETSGPQSAKSLRMESPEYGMQAFLWWRPEVGSRDLQMIRDAGFGWCKVNFGWRDIEGASKGAFDWSHTNRIMEMAEDVGLDLVVRVDHQPAWAGGGFPVNGPPDNYQDLADFLTALAERYRGRIRAYEVWNEPNLAHEWGGKAPDPGAYVELLGVAYEAIKSADPGAMVISAGLSPTATWSDEARPDDMYLENMYIAMGGDSDGYFDVLGVHGAGYKSPPERDPAEVAADPDLGGSRAFCFRRVEDLRAIMVEHGDENKQIALLEFGWTSDPRPESPYYWHRVSEETKADYFVRAYQYAEENWSPWIGLMSLIYICDAEWTPEDEQYWWAITYPGWPEFKPRPAYTALKAMPK